MACAICETRRPKRYCPGVRGDICPVCCGTEREVTVDCPLDCEYLREARLHERPPAIGPDAVPNQDIRVTEEFLSDNDTLLMVTWRIVAGAALDTPGVVDTDLKEALEALIRTYRTLQSGIVYDSLPTNPYAARIYGLTQNGLAEYRAGEQQRIGMSKTRDADVLGVLVFLDRLSLNHANGRRRGRAYIDFLRGMAVQGPEAASPAQPSLIVP